MRRHERRHPPQLCDQAKQVDFVGLRISMVGWSQNRLEGRALEHGLVALFMASDLLWSHMYLIFTLKLIHNVTRKVIEEEDH